MRRPPEHFLVYPTSPTAMIMEDYCASPRHYRSSTWSTNAAPVTPPAEIFQLKPGKKTPEAAATIRDLCQEPLFWRGYTSDEEVASPLIDDRRSFDSGSFCYDSEDVVSIHDETTPQQSTQSFSKAKMEGTHAQAVQYRSAGKAKVVSMSGPRIVRTAPSSPTRPAVSKMNRMNIEGRAINFSRTITPKASKDANFVAENTQTYEGPPQPKRVVRRKPDVPALQAVSRSQSPSQVSPSSVGPYSRRAGFVEPSDEDLISPLCEGAWFSQSTTPEDERPAARSKKGTLPSPDDESESYPAQEASPVPDSPPFSLPQKRSSNYVLQGSSSVRGPALLSSASHLGHDTYMWAESQSLSPPRLLRKLSSTFSFRTFNRPSRQDSFSSNESEKLQPVKEKTPKPTHIISRISNPSRASSKPPSKMVPRGANERAPPIVIPPCPDDYDDGDDLPARWPLRKDSAPDCAKCEIETNNADMTIEKEAKGPKLHQRKKSHSTSSGSGSS